LSPYPHCVPIHRLQICYDEENDKEPMKLPLEKGTGVLDFAPADFVTHNFAWGDGERARKVMLNVGEIPDISFSNLVLPEERNLGQVIVHNPVPGRCSAYSLRRISERLKISNSTRPLHLFTAYHYPGTLAQRNFRKDVRGSYLQRLGTSPPPEKCTYDTPAKDLRPWLTGFVDRVGVEEATRLLEGVGKTDGWPLADREIQRRRRSAVFRYLLDLCAALLAVAVVLYGLGHRGKRGWDRRGGDDVDRRSL